MTNWIKKIKIKHLFTKGEDWKSVQDSMDKIADVLEKDSRFRHLIEKLRNIPKGDDYFFPVDYANKLLNDVYSIADYERIWID